MERLDYCLFSSMKRVFAVLTAFVISAWCIAPAIADREQKVDSKPVYITFQVPGSTHIDSMFVNRDLTVTGTYDRAVFGQGAFVRDSHGMITQILPQGSRATIVAGINSDGTIAGWYSDATTNHGFLRDPDGTITTLDVGISTILYGINASGSVIGTQPSQAFVRDAHGAITIFNVPGSIDTVPTSINQSGEIAGIWFDVASNSHGFVRSPQGTITSFDPAPGVTGFNTLPSINRAGVIVGSYFTGSGPGLVLHSFARSPQGVITSIEIPGGINIQVSAINDSGTMVGAYSGGAFVLSRQGRVTSFEIQGAFATVPMSINNSGAIAGTYNSLTGTGGFLRLPNGSEIEDDGGDSHDN